MQRFELSDGKSHKFWEIATSGNAVTVRYGRIGTDGQTLTKKHASAAAAQKEHDKLVAEKTKKGYAPVTGSKSGSKSASKAKPTPRLTPLGRVINGYSNYLAILVADADVAAEYGGATTEYDAKGNPLSKTLDDHDRACKAIDKKEFTIGKGKGVVVEIGGCGVAEVLRLGDALVVPETYQDEDDVDLEAAREHVIATHPTTRPKCIGTVDVKSGVLVLMGLLEPGPKKLDAEKLAKSGVVKTKSGLALAVKPGRYDVWREEFEKEPEGDWGTMPSRVRVVPAGTKVLAGTPILALAPVGPAHEATPSGDRRLVDPKDEWAAISSLAVADDGRLFAGENGRFGVAAWDASGKLLWQRAIRPQKKKPDYLYDVKLALSGGDLIATCQKQNELIVLDAKTGKEKKKLTLPNPRNALVVKDRIIVRTGITTTVLSYPALKKVAELEEYVNGSGIAVSKDGKYLVVHGHEWHTYELKTLKHVRTVELDDDAYDVGFTSDGKVITVDGRARIKLWDPKTGKRVGEIDGAKERGRKPAANCVDASSRHIAIARDDGAVAVFDAKTRKLVHLFEKHLTAIPGTGSTEIADIAFTRDGKTLWVSAGPKSAPIGLTAYAV